MTVKGLRAWTSYDKFLDHLVLNLQEKNGKIVGFDFVMQY